MSEPTSASSNSAPEPTRKSAGAEPKPFNADDIKAMGQKLKKGLLKTISDGTAALDRATKGTKVRAAGEQVVRGARRPGAWKELLTLPKVDAPLPIREMDEAVASAIAADGPGSPLRDRLARFAQAHAPDAAEAVERLHPAFVAYVGKAPRLIESAAKVARDTGQAGKINPVLHMASTVFLAKDDMIPSDQGLLGLVDNAYLALGMLGHASELHSKRAGRPLFESDLDGANAAARQLLGPEHAGELDRRLQEIKDHEVFKKAVVGAAIAVGAALAAVVIGRQIGGGPAAGRALARGLTGATGTTPSAGLPLHAASSSDPTGGPGAWGGCVEDEIARLSAAIGMS